MKLIKLIFIMLTILSIMMMACKRKSDPEPEPVSYFQVLEVSGSHYDIGYAIGKQFQLYL